MLLPVRISSLAERTTWGVRRFRVPSSSFGTPGEASKRPQAIPWGMFGIRGMEAQVGRLVACIFGSWGLGVCGGEGCFGGLLRVR